MKALDNQEEKKIREIADITRSVLSDYETRGIFRLIEETPVGQKSSYQEREISEIPLNYLYGGVLLVCPRGDRTDGRMKIEISVRDCTIRVDRKASSADAMKLQRLYLKEGYEFEIMT